MDGKIFLQSAVDPADELEDALRLNYKVLLKVTEGVVESKKQDALLLYINKGGSNYDEVIGGLLFTILVQPTHSPKAFSQLLQMNRDRFDVLCRIILRIINDKWKKLDERAEAQLCWILNEMIQSYPTAAIDKIFFDLLRHLPGNTTKQFVLSDQIMALLDNNQAWFDKISFLTAAVAYSYLRLLADHSFPSAAKLLEKEVQFVSRLIRRRFDDCVSIGRDFVRALQAVSRIPEMEKIWIDLLIDPKQLSPNFRGINQLFNIRTSRKFLLTRISVELETKLIFVMSKVKQNGNQHYLLWLKSQYLSTKNDEPLRCDIIRFICAIYHPPNDILGSDVTQRWAMIQWLLINCQSSTGAANANLSLFYDWITYHEKESIMYIEPAILVMVHSLVSYPKLPVILLEFLCKLCTMFFPQRTDLFRLAIVKSFQSAIEKRVISSLQVLLDSPKVDADIRTLFRETFPTLFRSSPLIVPIEREVAPQPAAVEVPTERKTPVITANAVVDADFSDEETMVTENEEVAVVPCVNHFFDNLDHTAISGSIENLPDDVRGMIKQLHLETDLSERSEVVSRLLDTLTDNHGGLAKCLCVLMKNEIRNVSLPNQWHESESLDESIQSPLFTIFRVLTDMHESGSPNYSIVLQLVVGMNMCQSNILPLLLYFLVVTECSALEAILTQIFEAMPSCISLDTSFFQLFETLQSLDMPLFIFCLCRCHSKLTSQLRPHCERMILLICSSINSRWLCYIINQILMRKLSLLVESQLARVVNASTSWPTTDQAFFWQLISAHSFAHKSLAATAPTLVVGKQDEALSALMNELKTADMSVELILTILSRPLSAEPDYFTLGLLNHWRLSRLSKFCDSLGSLIVQCQRKKSVASIENILGHLEHWRQMSSAVEFEEFLTEPTIRQSLNFTQSKASEDLKAKFADLLAIAEEDVYEIAAENEPSEPKKKRKRYSDLVDLSS